MSFRILFVDDEFSAASEASQSRRFDCPRRCSSCGRSHATRRPIASTEAAPNACATFTYRTKRQSIRCRTSLSVQPKIDACRECKPKR